jgi:chromosome segregation ATPase
VPPSQVPANWAVLQILAQSPINKAVEDALRRILAQKEVVSELNDRKDARDEEMKKIFDDQQRLRENMKALKGSSEEKLLVQRYTQQLNDQETRLEKLGKEMEQIQKEMDAAQGVLDQTIRDLAVDTAV